MNIIDKLFNRPTRPELIINGTKIEFRRFGIKVFTSRKDTYDNIIWYLKREGFISEPPDKELVLA